MEEQGKNRNERSGNGNAREPRKVLVALLALGLGIGSVCTAAEDPIGAEEELLVQETEESGITPETVLEEVPEDVDDISMIFEDEEKFSNADTEIVPDTENEEDIDGMEEAVSEISVEVIQMSDGEDCDRNDMPGSEEGESSNELPESEQSGECGAQPGTVYWVLDEAGVLTVTGVGPMADWESVEQTPWFSYLGDLRKIVIAEGVASVGAHAFSGTRTVEAVELAQSIECVGAFAFFQCGGLGSVTIG